ncbi:MAG: EamA family transporter [Syntrophobacteraceae bacterium]|nr:EamA family transporter [Desulfobacteraceae bacterium]
MITALMVVVIVLSNAAGDVLITRGMKQVGEVATLRPMELLRIAGHVLVNRNFLLGVLSLTVSFFSFLAILTWADLSFVVPATSIVYVVSILGARFFLKEQINGLRWTGTILVCLGVALVCMP